MGNAYWVHRDNFTPTAGQDALTLISGSGRRIRLLQVRAGGRGSSSAAQALQVARSTGGTTPGGALTPSKADHTDQPAANFTTATTWAGQPTVGANDGFQLLWNALGGFAPHNANDGRLKADLEARNGENISFRIPAGVTPQAMSLAVKVEED